VFQRALEWLCLPFRSRRRARAILILLVVIVFGVWFSGRHLWAELNYRSARKALERYRLAEAQEHLEKCLQVWPSSFAVHLLAAQTARRLGNFEVAEQHLARCQEIRGALSQDVALEQTLIRAQRGGMDSVTPYLRSLVEQDDPATPLILEALVRGYLKAFRYGDAGMVLAVWLDRRPDDLEAHLFQGYVSETIGPESEAVSQFRRVLELDPEHDEARVRLADLLINRAVPAEALEHLELLTRRRPGDLYVLTRLARCQLALGQLQEAEQTVDRVLAEDRHFPPAVAIKGTLTLALGRPAEAERWLREVLAMDAANYQAQYSLAQSLRHQGKDQEAEVAEDRVKVLEADGVRIRKIIQEDINHSPNDPALRTEVGNILIRSGSVKDGVQWLYSALRQGPTYAPAHRALAAYFDSIGEPERAAPHRRFLEGGATEHPPGS
jgi:tetratricopeptide (TPR) repeat protein